MGVDLTELLVAVKLEGVDSAMTGLHNMAAGLRDAESGGSRAASSFTKVGSAASSAQPATARFATSLREMSNSASLANSGMSGLSSVLTGSLLSALARLAGALGVGFVIRESIAAAKDWADELERLQTVGGMTSRMSAGFAGAATLAGVSSEALSTILGRTSMALATHQQRFAQLGITIKDTATGAYLPMSTIILNSINGLDRYSEGASRDAAATYLWSRAAANLLPELERLKDQLDPAKFAETLKLMEGLGLDLNNAKQASMDWHEALGLLHLELTAVGNQIGTALLPYIKTLGSDIADLAKRGELKQWAEESARAVLDVVIAMTDLASFIEQHREVIGIGLATIGGSAFLKTGSISALGMFAAGWEMTGTAATKAADAIHAATLKAHADAVSLRDSIGLGPNSKPPISNIDTSDTGGNKQFANPNQLTAEKLLTTEKEKLDLQIRENVAALTERQLHGQALANEIAAAQLAKIKEEFAIKHLALTGQNLASAIALTNAEGKQLAAAKDIVSAHAQDLKNQKEALALQKEAETHNREAATSLLGLLASTDKLLKAQTEYNKALADAHTALGVVSPATEAAIMQAVVEKANGLTDQSMLLHDTLVGAGGILKTSFADALTSAKSITDVMKGLGTALEKFFLDKGISALGNQIETIAAMHGMAGFIGPDAIRNGTSNALTTALMQVQVNGVVNVNGGIGTGGIGTGASSILSQQQNLAANGFPNALPSGAMPATTGLNDLLKNVGDFWTGMSSKLSSFATSVEPQWLSAFFSSIGSILGISGGLGGASSIAPIVAHGGGIVGVNNFSSRSVASAAFLNAPFLHMGLNSDEFPAILERGEKIIPRNGARDSSAGNGRSPVYVNIQNASGAQVSNETREHADGSLSIEVVVANAIKSDLKRGGTIDQSLRNSYGLQRTPTRR